MKRCENCRFWKPLRRVQPDEPKRGKCFGNRKIFTSPNDYHCDKFKPK